MSFEEFKKSGSNDSLSERNENKVEKIPNEKENGLLKEEMENAIKTGDVDLALGAFLQLNEKLPKNRGEESFDYAGSYAKEIMDLSINTAKTDSADFNKIKSMIEIFLSLREYFPESRGERSFDYAGSYAKDIMTIVINVIKKEKEDDSSMIKLAKEALKELSPYLPTENRGREFDYATSYAKDLDCLS